MVCNSSFSTGLWQKFRAEMLESSRQEGCGSLPSLLFWQAIKALAVMQSDAHIAIWDCGLTHSERKPQHIYSQEEINLYCIIKLIGKKKFFIFITNQYNLMFCVDKIKYEHLAILSNLKSCQFAPRIVIFNLCIHSCTCTCMLPIWGFRLFCLK